VLTFSVAQAAPKHIGSIKKLKGKVEVMRNAVTFPPVIGAHLYKTDILRTGKDGSMGIVLLDDTIFSMGPNSELEINEFEFDTKNKAFALVSRMLKGTFIFISGTIAKLSPESVKLSIPDGDITIRGTKLAIQVKEK